MLLVTSEHLAGQERQEHSNLNVPISGESTVKKLSLMRDLFRDWSKKNSRFLNGGGGSLYDDDKVYTRCHTRSLSRESVQFLPVRIPLSL